MLVWDPRKLEAPVFQHDLDTQSGVLMAFVDEDTGLVFLGGKGDGNLRVFDLPTGCMNIFIFFLSPNWNTGSEPQPKRYPPPSPPTGLVH